MTRFEYAKKMLDFIRSFSANVQEDASLELEKLYCHRGNEMFVRSFFEHYEASSEMNQSEKIKSSFMKALSSL